LRVQVVFFELPAGVVLIYFETRSITTALFAPFGGVGRRQAHGDRIGMHIQPHVKGRAATGADHALDPRLGLWLGRCDEAVPLRLDSLGVAEYVGLHGVCFPFIQLFELGFTTLGLGTPARAGAQSPFPESRHLTRFHHKPYCLGGSTTT
jgi:hypothetical protein